MRNARVARLKTSLLAAGLFLPLATPLAAQHNGARPAPAASPAEDGQWTMPSKNYASTRYSGLNEVNRSNVARLKLAFTFDTHNRKGQEAAPLVVGSMMYITTPYPNHIWALDLTRGGKPVWVFRPHPQPAAQGVACCDVVNRGATYSNGRLFFTTLDGEVFAIDAKTGHQVWRTKLGDISKGETMTMSPLVAEGKVLVGNSGGEMGVRGWMTALDAGSGRIAWKAYSTGPDKDVLIGPNFHPFTPPTAARTSGSIAGRPAVEDRRRHRLGLDQLRPAIEDDLLRHRQSGPVEPGAAARRQQVDDRRVRPRHRHRPGALVLPVEPARFVRP
jgi:glucose dehydrogenase